AANPVLGVVRTPGRNRTSPRLDDTRAVLFGDRKGPVLQCVARHSHVVEDRATDEFDVAGGTHGADETGDAVDDQPQALFAAADDLFRAFALVDVRIGGVPFDDRAALVERGGGAKEKPPILAVPAP